LGFSRTIKIRHLGSFGRFLGQSTDLPSPKAKVELGSRVDLVVPKESSVVPEEPTLQVGNWTKVVKDEEPSKVIDIAEVASASLGDEGKWMESV